jgi:hypothetical protein
MTALGQNRKSSMRANVFRFAPESGLKSDMARCPVCAADIVEKLDGCEAADAIELPLGSAPPPQQPSFSTISANSGLMRVR